MENFAENTLEEAWSLLVQDLFPLQVTVVKQQEKAVGPEGCQGKKIISFFLFPVHILTSFETTTEFGNAIRDISGTAGGCMPVFQGIKMFFSIGCSGEVLVQIFLVCLVFFFKQDFFLQIVLLDFKKQLQLLASIGMNLQSYS